MVGPADWVQPVPASTATNAAAAGNVLQKKGQRNPALALKMQPGKKLQAHSKIKIDELFLSWLSVQDTQELISSLIEDAKAGRSLGERLPHFGSGAKSPAKQGHGGVAGGPPLSPTKSPRKLRFGSPPTSPLGRQPRFPDKPEREAANSSFAQIPRFYFPKGKPVPEQVLRETKEKIEALFLRMEGQRARQKLSE